MRVYVALVFVIFCFPNLVLFVRALVGLAAGLRATY